MSEKRVAIVGGGIAGITCAYRLHPQASITLYEKSHRIGGNAYSYTTRDGENVDIAVAAFGQAGYKNFYKLLTEVGVSTDLSPNSYMSFFNLDSKQGLFIPGSLKGILKQNVSLLRPRNIKTIMNLFVGLNKSKDLVDAGYCQSVTFGDLIGSIPEFRDDTYTILLCTLCLLSSMTVDEVLATPAEFFINKLRVHNDVLSPKAVFSVRSMRNGTRSYINALTAPFRDRIVLNAGITKITRTPKKVSVHRADGTTEDFNAVVFACPPNEVLALLDNPSEREHRLLGSWKYKAGRVVLHQDHSAFPAKDLMQAYTFLYRRNGNTISTSVNGALRFEAHTSKKCNFISSQHPNFEIRPDLIELDTVLHTPIFDSRSCATQSQLPSLNGYQNSFYCGSYFGFGLHEDAVSSALDAAILVMQKNDVANSVSKSLALDSQAKQC